MKEGWEKILLGSVFSTVTGGTPSKSNENFYGHYIPFVKPPELRDSALSSAEDYLSKSGAAVARIAPPNSILVSCIGNLGKIGLNTVPVAFNQQINAILPNEDKALPSFVFYQTLAKSFKDQLESLASGTTVSIVNKSKFNAIEIILPSLPEQQRIVALLDEAFEAIATAKTHAEQNLKNARAVFESHLDMVFRQRGEGWVETTLESIGTTQTGSTPKRSDQLSYGDFMPFVKPGDFKIDGTLNYESDGLSQTGAALARKVQAGSVLMICIGATIGKSGFCERNIATNQQINAFTPYKNIFYKFIYYQMLTQIFQRQVIHASGQATLPIINKSKWSALTILVPPTFDEQLKVVDALDRLREESQHLESIYRRKIAALDELKASLLHKAFAGEL